MSSLFPAIGPRQGPPTNYLDFWNGLERDVTKYEYYRGHQLKILDEYELIPETDRDVAICLPTGTGKTLIGLSLSRYAQVRRKQRVLYLSPYILLASQILEEAKGLGIPAVPLYGTWSAVDQSAKDLYSSGEAVGVGTYSTLFNANPRVGRPELIVLDDVHAAADFVLNPWLVRIPKNENPELFVELTDILRGQLPRGQFATLEGTAPIGRSVEMVRARDWLMVVDSFQSILDQYEDGSKWRFGWRGIRDKLDNCFCFLSSDAITLRPWVPPTYELPDFITAKRRVYLSATIDRWGNIEHIMGIEPIRRLTLTTVPIPGRRLILNLNRLIPGVTDSNRIVQMATMTPKALVLCKSHYDRDTLAQTLRDANYGGSILGSGTLEDDVAKFREEEHAILVLANLYDGLDLGNGVCRNIILWKLPLAIGEQEAFTTYTWRLVAAAESRARQRIQQGMGRCTRRDADAVLVGLVGQELVDFILQPKVQSAIPSKLRAELELCAKLLNPGQFKALVTSCLQRTADWKQVSAQVDSLASTLPEETYPDEQVMEVHRREATFNRLLWTRNYSGASSCAQSAAQQLVDIHAESAAGPWFYLASVSEDLQQFEASGNPYSVQGGRLLHESSSRQEGRTWFGELESYVELPKVAPIHELQVTGIETFLRAFPLQTSKLDDDFNKSLSNLAQTESEHYRRGLKVLGESLGLHSQTPTRQGGADAIWSLANDAVIIFEAKTDKLPDSSLSVNEVRQIVNLVSEAKANEKVNASDQFLPTCITSARKIAREVQHEVERFDIARTKDVTEFARRWFERISLLHKRTELGTPECKVLIQGALSQLRASHTQLSASLGIKSARSELAVDASQTVSL